LEGTFKLKSAMAALIENINIQNVPEKRKYPKDNPAAAKKRNNGQNLIVIYFFNKFYKWWVHDF
jgi:hypothetical protein